MFDKEKILEELSKKSNKSIEDLEKMIKEKINELSGLISEEGAIHIIANELDVDLTENKPKKIVNLVKIEEIKEPKISVSFYGKVIRKYEEIVFSNSNTEGRVQSLLLGDDTGVIRVTFWNDKVDLLTDVKEGDVLKIVNAFSRENQDRIEVNYGSYSDLEVNPEGIEIEVKYEIPEPEEKKISELKENDNNVKVSGIITDFDIPRFYIGCPNCFKKISQEENEEGKKVSICSVHGEVEPYRVPIVNLRIDDGTGNLVLVGFRNNAEKLLNLSSDEIFKIIDNIEIYRALLKQILEKKVVVSGNVSLSSLTGDLQLVVNNVFENEFTPDKSIFEKEEKKDSEEKEKEDKNERKDDSNKKNIETDLNNKSIDDEIDLEEIDIDDI